MPLKTEKSPDRQPYGWYPRFAYPHPLPEVAPSDSKKSTDREVAEQLKSLNKDLARYQRRGAKLAAKVKELCTPSDRKNIIIGNLSSLETVPVVDLPWSHTPSMKAAGRAAVEHAENLSRMIDIREKISELNARTSSTE